MNVLFDDSPVPGGYPPAQNQFQWPTTRLGPFGGGSYVDDPTAWDVRFQGLDNLISASGVDNPYGLDPSIPPGSFGSLLPDSPRPHTVANVPGSRERERAVAARFGCSSCGLGQVSGATAAERRIGRWVVGGCVALTLVLFVLTIRKGKE